MRQSFIRFALLCLAIGLVRISIVHAAATDQAKPLTQLQQEGRDTWYLWTGGDTDAQGHVVGDQELWRLLAIRSHGSVDLLQAIDSRYRNVRFHRFGVMNDPDCHPATAPDKYGLWLDICPATESTLPVGQPAGIVGLRRFLNPKFDPARWDLAKYQADPASVEPPYLIGVACAFCHVGFNPLHPPANPEHPEWHNLHPGIGNQYFREQIFNTAKYPDTRELQPNDFRWQVANAEPPGTSDTSQVATDHIFDPGTINNIVSLDDRPLHAVMTADGVSRHVYNILKDGADSVGSACLDDPTSHPGHNDTACAALRGYLNIGLCADSTMNLHDPIYGLSTVQKPFHIQAARRADKPCDEAWTATAARLEGLEAFLRTFTPFHLADADGAATYLPTDSAQLTRGKLVFAENCASCHSSKRPPKGTLESERNWFREAVLQPDFLTNNFLSEDERHPDSEIGTNAERALASNAKRGQLWEEFSSETYKNSAPVNLPGLPRATGGTGYYRTPTLINIWATAPFLHNNAIGLYNADPSVAGRLAAYENAMQLLLSPELRSGKRSIHLTTEKSNFPFEAGGHLCVPANTPIDLITNLNVSHAPTPPSKFKDAALCTFTSSGLANPILHAKDNVPDFIQDRGHTFGSTLSAEDKRALIEYMKLF